MNRSVFTDPHARVTRNHTTQDPSRAITTRPTHGAPPALQRIRRWSSLARAAPSLRANLRAPSFLRGGAHGYEELLEPEAPQAARAAPLTSKIGELIRFASRTARELPGLLLLEREPPGVLADPAGESERKKPTHRRAQRARRSSSFTNLFSERRLREGAAREATRASSLRVTLGSTFGRRGGSGNLDCTRMRRGGDRSQCVAGGGRAGSTSASAGARHVQSHRARPTARASRPHTRWKELPECVEAFEAFEAFNEGVAAAAEALILMPLLGGDGARKRQESPTPSAYPTLCTTTSQPPPIAPPALPSLQVIFVHASN